MSLLSYIQYMQEAIPRQIEEYITAEGRVPFSQWLKSLNDRKTRARIRVRLDRLSMGNLGDCRSLGGSLYELRLNYGPGYRVYFGEVGERVILLLAGGTKKSQQRDIVQARNFWTDFRRREL